MSARKPIHYVASAKKDLQAFPEPVRDLATFALETAVEGGKHPKAKPLKGFGCAGVLEVVEDHQGGTYRAVYTVKFDSAVYVLHAFQKKSTLGIKTPKKDVDKVKARLKLAEQHHRDSAERAKK